MAERQKLPRLTTPVGVARFPRLNKPDTKFVKVGEYSTKLVLDPDTITDIIATINELRDEKLEAVKAQLTQAIKDAKTLKAKNKAELALSSLTVNENAIPDVNDDDEETGLVVLNFKMKAKVETTTKTWEQKPIIFDAKGKKLDNPPAVWGGSKLKVNFEAVPYYMGEQNAVGVTLRMRGVQIIELVSGNGGNAESMGFGVEEGYSVDDSAVSFPSETDAAAPGAAADADDF